MEYDLQCTGVLTETFLLPHRFTRHTTDIKDYINEEMNAHISSVPASYDRQVDIILKPVQQWTLQTDLATPPSVPFDEAEDAFQFERINETNSYNVVANSDYIPLSTDVIPYTFRNKLSENVSLSSLSTDPDITNVYVTLFDQDPTENPNATEVDKLFENLKYNVWVRIRIDHPPNGELTFLLEPSDKSLAILSLYPTDATEPLPPCTFTFVPGGPLEQVHRIQIETKEVIHNQITFSHNSIVYTLDITSTSNPSAINPTLSGIAHGDTIDMTLSPTPNINLGSLPHAKSLTYTWNETHSYLKAKLRSSRANTDIILNTKPNPEIVLIIDGALVMTEWIMNDTTVRHLQSLNMRLRTIKASDNCHIVQKRFRDVLRIQDKPILSNLSWNHQSETTLESWEEMFMGDGDLLHISLESDGPLDTAPTIVVEVLDHNGSVIDGSRTVITGGSEQQDSWKYTWTYHHTITSNFPSGVLRVFIDERDDYNIAI
jgi:hypothetical protein